MSKYYGYWAANKETIGKDLDSLEGFETYTAAKRAFQERGSYGNQFKTMSHYVLLENEMKFWPNNGIESTYLVLFTSIEDAEDWDGDLASPDHIHVILRPELKTVVTGVKLVSAGIGV